MIGEGRPLVPEMLDQTGWVRAKSPIFEFRSLFARSDSALTPCERSSINTNRKSTTRFSMSQKCTSYVVPKPPPKGWQKTQCPKFEQYAAITPKRYEIGYQLLITNRKSHTGFRLVPTSMMLNDRERRNSTYFAFLTEFDRFSGRLYHGGWR